MRYYVRYDSVNNRLVISGNAVAPENHQNVMKKNIPEV